MFARTIARCSAVRRRYYISASHHMWVSPTPEKMTPPTPDGRHQPPSTYRIEMGLTSHGLRDIGDVTAVRSALSSSPSPIGKPVIKDDPLLRIDWEGYAITSADELYHTVWENVEGTYEVTSPVSGVLKEIRRLDYSSLEDIDETDVLAVVVSKREELEQVARGWVGEEEYRKILEKKESGGAGEGEGPTDERIFETVEGGWSG
mmetsp:Transcript_29611/g.53722  ORF Transcript_29611/g.53722 Transcript_29611/m.53722 type:complete len:204 (-) Transcript_29611:429-1040(-)